MSCNVQVPRDGRQQDRWQWAPHQRAHSRGRGGGQFSQVDRVYVCRNIINTEPFFWLVSMSRSCMLLWEWWMERSERINYFLFDFKVWNTFAGVCEVLLSPAQKGTWEHFHEQSRGLETNPVNTSWNCLNSHLIKVCKNIQLMECFHIPKYLF